MDVPDAIGGFYSNMPRKIKASSLSATEYMAKMYNRNGVVEDPWISI